MGAGRWVTAGSVLLAFACAGTPAQAAVARCNEAITMSDGTVLRANVVLPEAEGRRPVIITATGYNKDVTNPTGTSCGEGGGLVSIDQSLLKQGYAVMLLDDRGTGASGGQWDSWGERTQTDYEEVLDWIQAQPWSDGQVGATGGSYMGITSLFLAQADQRRIAQGKPRAVKAVWADVPMSDAYRDVTFHGGAIDAGFIPLWLGLTTSLSNVPPSTTLSEPLTSLPVYAQHLLNTFDFAGRQVIEASTGADGAFDSQFFRTRSPGEKAHTLDIPVAWVGGWWDIFQRGEPLLFEQLVNSPRRLFFMTPNYHGAPDRTAWDALGIGSESSVRNRWFDRYLKDADDPELDALKPVNLWTLGADRWQHAASWPVPGTRYEKLHLATGNALQWDAPAQGGGDPRFLLPVSSPCSRLSMQWTAGLADLGPCETDNRSLEATAHTYSTAPLAEDTKVTGLITADVHASLSSADATLVAILSDVAPDGTSTQITAGFLQASQRAVDEDRSTKTRDGLVIRPFHPFTRDSQQPVPPNVPQRYRIEVYPTSNVFKKGHRIRLTLSGANTPSTLPSVPQTVASAGGRLTVLHGGRYPSHVLLPLEGAPAPQVAGLPSTKRCLSRRVFTIRVDRLRKGERVRRARVIVGGRPTKARRGADGRWRATVDLRGRRASRVAVRIRVVTSKGRTVTSTRTYRTCTRRR